MSVAEVWKTKPARAATCHCGAALIYCLSEGVPQRVDIHALTAAGELAAILAGRMTFALIRGELLHRHEFRIKHGKAAPIFAAHRCGTRIDRRYWAELVTPTIERLDNAAPRF